MTKSLLLELISVYNWNEDRLQASCSFDESKKIAGGTGARTLVSRADEGFPEISKSVSNYNEAFINIPHYTRFNQPDTKERILPSASAATGGPAESSSTFYQKAVLEPRPEPKPKTRPMVNKANIHEIHQPRATGAPLEGYGATLPGHKKESDPSQRWVTTNQRMYVDDPAKARLRPPPPDKLDDERFVGGLPASCNPNFPEKGRLLPTDRTFFRTRSFPGDDGTASDCLKGSPVASNSAQLD
ncbi:hypothetical protein KFL_006570030 [Klebsormidium nitens]|uniref:Uncharacterized protein n=1 Tax=Klebsormidium nitens TaxID=105231 RepID=A0A1Y1IR04_KLENI|nr:hypothetical protein KFL_006570030 [Klebsormidium nitens]|eukprot:GAQ90568.1 hypothetical protein KFL_006570030 [Klebsormidium nitens]